MSSPHRTMLAAWVIVASFAASGVAKENVSPVVESFNKQLAAGKLAAAQDELSKRLQAAPTDDQARFALGFTQTLAGVERLMQSLYRYGLEPVWHEELPFLRLPVPSNPKPDALTNKAFREIVSNFDADLAKAEKTLAGVKSADVKLPLMLGTYRLDFDGDGKATEDEALWRILDEITHQGVTAETAAGFMVMADAGDVHWLRGYCHALESFCEMFLAYDTQALHDRTAQMFFPHAVVKNAIQITDHREIFDSILDAVAFIHLVQLPVIEPERMKRAHEHILVMIDQSRESWKAILAETDDDHEWIPNPKQKNSVMPNARITPVMVDGWKAALDEAEKVLKGEKLAPFWRGGSRGINLKKVFYEPTTFDLVLWIQGSAALPYLEDGPITDAELWNQVTRGFEGELFWFAIWVN